MLLIVFSYSFSGLVSYRIDSIHFCFCFGYLYCSWLSLLSVCESSVAVKRLAGKTISEMICNVSRSSMLKMIGKGFYRK